MALLRRVAYAALGIPFIVLGYHAAAEPGGRVQKAAELGVPEPETMVRVNGAAMVVGGAALTVGVLPRLAALGLAASLVPTTLAGHPFWKHEGPDRGAQRTQLLKNLSMFGGLLAVAVTPRRRRRARTRTARR